MKPGVKFGRPLTWWSVVKTDFTFACFNNFKKLFGNSGKIGYGVNLIRQIFL